MVNAPAEVSLAVCGGSRSSPEAESSRSRASEALVPSLRTSPGQCLCSTVWANLSRHSAGAAVSRSLPLTIAHTMQQNAQSHAKRFHTTNKISCSYLGGRIATRLLLIHAE